MLSSSQGLTNSFRKSPKDVLQQKQHRKPRKQPLGPFKQNSSPGDAESSRKEAVSGRGCQKEGSQQKRGRDWRSWGRGGQRRCTQKPGRKLTVWSWSCCPPGCGCGRLLGEEDQGGTSGKGCSLCASV